MLLLAIIIAAWVVATGMYFKHVANYKKEYEDPARQGHYTFPWLKPTYGVYAFGATMASLLGFIFIIFFGLFYTEVFVEEQTIRVEKLHAINDSSGTSGSFFLGSGSIDEKPVYLYYYKEGEAFRRGSIDADDAEIFYSDGTPRIEYRGAIIPRWIDPIGGDIPQGLSRIYVPEGSISSQYEFDNK